MTIRVPRIVLIALAALIVLGGAGAGAYFLFLSDDEDCVSRTNGESIDCGEPLAVSEEEYQAQQEEEARARAAAQQKANECEDQLGGFLTELEDLNSRLSVGLAYAAYSRHVGDIQVAYDQVQFKELDFGCLTNVGVTAEKALRSYAQADDTWNNCLTDFGCDTDSIDPELQDRWSSASAGIDLARNGLQELAKP
jgi:hypothetical protein